MSRVGDHARDTVSQTTENKTSGRDRIVKEECRCAMASTVREKRQTQRAIIDNPAGDAERILSFESGIERERETC